MAATITEIREKSVDMLQQRCVEVMMTANNDIVSIMPGSMDDIISHFVSNLEKLFDAIQSDSRNEESASIDFDNLSVIVGDELDVVMAIQRLVKVARNNYLPQFAKLSARMNTLLANIEFNEANNPLDPDQLFTAFKEAIRPLNLKPERSVKLIKLFDSIVMSDMQNVLNLANQILIDANILPELGLGDEGSTSAEDEKQHNTELAQDDEASGQIETAAVSDIVGRIQQTALGILKEQFDQVLFGIETDMFPLISSDREDAIFRFSEQIEKLFQRISGDKKSRNSKEIDFDSLSLILEDELEVVMAVEGMVAAARNKYLPLYVNFNARMNELLQHSKLNELNNPLDPDQLFTAFKEASRPFGVTGKRNLEIFRLFNTLAIGELETLLTSVNQILIDENILPDLDLAPITNAKQGASRHVPRSVSAKESTSNYGLPGKDSSKNVVQEQNFEEDDENPELFAMVQGLMHGESSSPSASAGGETSPSAQPAQPGAPGQIKPVRQYVIPDELLTSGKTSASAFEPAPDQTVEIIDPKQLQTLLSNIQSQLSQLSRISGKSQAQEASEPNIKATLASLLKEQQAEGVVNAVDRQSSDAINLVELLYEAIWNDEAVPIPIKELIGRTQITVIMVVLNDTSFFNRVNHPVRALLNEFANAGIGWSEVENLEADSLYQKISQTVQHMLTEYKGQDGFFEDLLADFRSYRAREAARGKRLEQRIKHTREGATRAEFARKLVSQRIKERILGREVEPFVKEFLAQDFHKFMVLLVLKEGPGSKAWKQAVNTIDVLLWSVQSHDQSGDRAKLDTINPRLMSNLKRALRIASLEDQEIDEKLAELGRIQLETFPVEAKKELPMEEILGEEEVVKIPTVVPDEPDTIPPAKAPAAEEVLADDDPSLKQVDEFGIGTWFEFLIEEDQHIRCKLAARINAIDKLIFVNRQGVKVIEKTRMGLAIELKNESVKVISDGLLFTRALESVIGNLRESQAVQQTPA